MFIEDRRQREEQQAEERRKWEAEMRMREAAYTEERRRREEENRKQMEVLQALVQGVQLQGEAAKKRAEGEKDVRVAKLTEDDDIVAYLTMFERLMVAYEVKKGCWAFKLAPNLVGKSQQAESRRSRQLREVEGGNTSTIRHHRGELQTAFSSSEEEVERHNWMIWLEVM